MLKVVLFCVAVVHATLALEEDKRCPNNETHVSCVQPIGCMTCESPYLCFSIQCTGEGCDCIQDYVRNDLGACIKETDCPDDQTCPTNEIYSKCAQPRTHRTCKNPNNCENCTCTAGCDCVQGYYRNSFGTCIPRHHCPVLNGECEEDEAYYDHIPNCKNTCEAFGNPGIRCAAGPKGCFCKEGLVKRSDDKCVKYEDCDDMQESTLDEEKCYLEHEEYSRCGSGCAKTCDNLNEEIVCAAVCVEGCFCMSGYFRNSNGDCVPEDQCTQVQESALDEENCDKEHEEYSQCGSACTKTCKNLNEDIACPDVCVKGCFCVSGYIRNSDGECVPENQCTQVQKSTSDESTCEEPNEEHLSCGSACPKTCKNPFENTLCTENCIDGCFCKEGFFRNNDGACVPLDKCKKDNTDRCKENEEYSTCGTYCPKTCKNYNIWYACILTCEKGCFCKNGFVRNDSQECVLPSNC